MARLAETKPHQDLYETRAAVSAAAAGAVRAKEGECAVDEQTALKADLEYGNAQEQVALEQARQAMVVRARAAITKASVAATTERARAANGRAVAQAGLEVMRLADSREESAKDRAESGAARAHDKEMRQLEITRIIEQRKTFKAADARRAVRLGQRRDKNEQQFKHK